MIKNPSFLGKFFKFSKRDCRVVSLLAMTITPPLKGEEKKIAMTERDDVF